MKKRVRVTKEFDFETAHALDGYNGKCKDIHGHSYHLKITAVGTVNEDEMASDQGMVIDFGILKAVVKEHIYSLFDHRLILKNNSRFKGIEHKNERVRYVPYQPTCENMLLDIVNLLQENLPNSVALHNVSLRETATSSAQWFASDNE
jgi:6-pyruvoyltetrahydropterin/6-carboxytetrahydropterin synthase